jgi:hypothetical protein
MCFYMNFVSNLLSIYITITILDIIHRSVFYLKHYVSETGFCLCFQVEITELAQ